MVAIRPFAILALLSLGTAVVGRASGTSTNPILPGFHPDPSICRAGDDYYLVTSSFEWFPGVPIFQSRDLVHWNPIGHVLARPSNLDLDGVECSGGIYAPTLRYHDHRFYMITTLIGAAKAKGNFVVTADNPRGPWSDPHWIKNAEGIDPSLFFDDDGRAYYCGNGRPKTMVNDKHRIIWIQELDLQSWTLTGPRGELDSAEYFASGKLGPVNNFEGPHLYKKDGRYYLMLSHGGTSQNHAVSIWSGPGPLDPFLEANPANPIVTHRGDHPDGITCTGHADLVQTSAGEWWMVLLGVRSNTGYTNMGRESFLVPVDWSGKWPVVNPNGRKARVENEVPLPRLPLSAERAQSVRDNFENTPLGPQWNWIRTPHTPWWSLTDRPGWLTLHLRPEQVLDKSNPSFVGMRQEQARCEASTRLDFMPVATECAGLAVLRSRTAAFQLVVEVQDGRRVVAVYENARRIAMQSLASNPTELKITLNGPRLAFLYSTAPNTWEQLTALETTLLANAPDGRFTGTFVGVYASSRGQASTATASFDWFEYRNL